MNDTEKQEIQYWTGKGFSLNRLSLWYFYLNVGLNTANDFRYIVGYIVALYFALKLDNPWLMVGVFVVAIPLLEMIGALRTKYMTKRLDFFTTQFASHWSKYGYNLQEQILEELKKLNSK